MYLLRHQFKRSMNLQQIIAKKIRDLYQDGEAAKDLADQYKISISLVYSIIRNE